MKKLSLTAFEAAKLSKTTDLSQIIGGNFGTSGSNGEGKTTYKACSWSGTYGDSTAKDVTFDDGSEGCTVLDDDLDEAIA